MRLLRVYHSGRDAAHRLRDRALLDAGVDVTLVVPHRWPDAGSQRYLSDEPFPVIELPVARAGDVNRHRYNRRDIGRVLAEVNPDLLDLHEEPFATVTRQWLTASPGLPSVAYTAQNIDKRWPPPFVWYEQAAFSRLIGLYPCSRQAASVARGKGFGGLVEVLPLGLDADRLTPGRQRHDDPTWTLLLVGRLVPEKGVQDAVGALARVRQQHPARLVIVGQGPEGQAAVLLANRLGIADAVDLKPWTDAEGLAELYRDSHIVLAPSRATRTWVEQFGRVITEGQACGAVVVGWSSGSISEVSAGLALLTAEGDVSGLSDAVLQLVHDRQLYDGLRSAGLRRAASLSWSHVAACQAAFYEAALSSQGTIAVARADRAVALAEFGPPADVAGGGRPFALPVLREDNGMTRLLARICDARPAVLLRGRRGA